MEQSQPVAASRLQRIAAHGRAAVDGASLAVFRMAFGALIALEVGRYFLNGWIAGYYIDPSFHFTYYGFGWVHPWPGPGMYVHFALLGAAAVCVALGLWYRVAAPLLWLAFTYVFLLDEARYLNHFYAASLFAFLLTLVPAHRTWSIDARRTGRDGSVPRWTVWLLRTQVGIIYFFGGVAKINGDWVHGEPMRSWLLERANVPLVDLVVRNRLELYLFSYGGLFFDLLVAPALLWRRTRPFAFAAAVVFHVMNSQLFSIGIFPWMMIAATTLFFTPDWPRRCVAVFSRQRREPVVLSAGVILRARSAGVILRARSAGVILRARSAGVILRAPSAGVILRARSARRITTPDERSFASLRMTTASLRMTTASLRMTTASLRMTTASLRMTLASPPMTPASLRMILIAAYVVLQLLIPLRHFAYPGNVSWTEEGHRFSWQMKLRDKTGTAYFIVTNSRTHETTVVEPQTMLTSWQTAKMATRPDMILQFAHHIADERRKSGQPVEVRVLATVSLNGRESRQLVDPAVNLAAERRTLSPAPWVIRGEPERPDSIR